MRLAKIYGMIIVATALLGLNFQANAAAGAAALAEPVVTSMYSSAISSAFHSDGDAVDDTQTFQAQKIMLREKDDGIIPESAPKFYIRLTFKSVPFLMAHPLKPTGNPIIDRPISPAEALEFIDNTYKRINFKPGAPSGPQESRAGYATFFMCRNATGDLDIYDPSPYIFKAPFAPHYAIDAADGGITLVNHGIPVVLSLQAFLRT